MNEWTKEKLEQEIEKSQLTAIYFYTPMCGTCNVASKMMSVIVELFPTIHFGKSDVNYIQPLASHWQIESVPCLIVFHKGKMLEKLYAFHSVDYLYRLFQNLQNIYGETPKV
ncbi:MULTISPECIES: thioredoxin family protein [Bacillus]|uniref:thioredoxin family protein n=1 Tax=Bacillus TaxID=1386 RepID=UPI000BB958CC|nr:MULTISPECIES: thioredoxin family protein [Bacillus]